MSKKIAIAYITRTGNTQELAENIQKGAEEAGASVWIDMIDELDPKDVSSYDVIALGCPAMGEEELDGTFRKYFEQLKPYLKGKRAVLFGSWGWGNGAYMKKWEQECLDAGIELVTDSLTCKKFPDEEAVRKAQELGQFLAK